MGERYIKQLWRSNQVFAMNAALSFALTFFSFGLFGQTNNVIYEDVILLNSLKKVRGTIVDSIPGVSVDIKLHNQSTTTILRENIFKITREPYQDDQVKGKKSASSKEYEDVILLSSAQVLRGIITDSIPGESVTIRLHNDSISTVSKDDVVTILREPRRFDPKSDKIEQSDKSHHSNAKSGGAVGIIELGYGIGREQDQRNSIRLNGIIAQNMQGAASLGAGLGIRYVPEDDALVLPLFLDLRISPLKGSVSPFIGFSIGSSVQTADGADFFSGTMIHAQGGLELAKSGKSGVMFSIGYEQFDIQGRESVPNNFAFGFPAPNRLRARTIKTMTLNLAFKF